MSEVPLRWKRFINKHFIQDDLVGERNARNLHLGLMTVIDAAAAVSYFGFHKGAIAVGLAASSVAPALTALISELSRRNVIKERAKSS